MRRTYIATVQIIISPDEGVENEDQAADFFTELLTENEAIEDWSYLKIGNQYLYPEAISIMKGTYRLEDAIIHG